MKSLAFIMLLSFVNFNIAHAECADGVTMQISSNGKLSEADRERLTKECEDFKIFKQKVKTDPTDAYLLDQGNFTCLEREDYIEIFNFILEHGVQYYPRDILKFNKSCSALKSQVLVKIVQEKIGDPVVQVRYEDRWVTDCLYTMWVHKKFLIPYSDLLNQKIK